MILNSNLLWSSTINCHLHLTQPASLYLALMFYTILKPISVCPHPPCLSVPQIVESQQQHRLQPTSTRLESVKYHSLTVLFITVLRSSGFTPVVACIGSNTCHAANWNSALRAAHHERLCHLLILSVCIRALGNTVCFGAFPIGVERVLAEVTSVAVSVIVIVTVIK